MPGLNGSGALSIYAYAEMNYLRMEAMDLFERCLTDGQTTLLLAFIDYQISHEPPRVELLRELAEDLHQRLLSLRENHFDVRERVLRVLYEHLHIDLSPFIPLQSLEQYHLLRADDALTYLRAQYGWLTPEDEALVRRTIESSLELAAQLYRDVSLTQYLYDYVMDWVMGLNATATRRYWADTYFESGDDPVH